MTFAFIGLGLIGGSIARAIRAKYPDAEILAWDPDLLSVKIAVQDKVVTTALPAIGPELRAADVVFLCAPVGANADNLEKVAPHLSPAAILTDVGSVKTNTHKKVRQMHLSSQFIGGHPMAGSERIGYRNSSAQLLENAYYALTPEADFPAEKAAWFRDFISSIGALPMVMTCEEHDYVTAAISHLPHVVSAALVNLVKESDNEEGLMKTMAAGGFKDITRISSSSPVMWEQICLANPENILSLLDRYIAALRDFREKLAEENEDGPAAESDAGQVAVDGGMLSIHKNSDTLREYFRSAQEYRDSFSEAASGPIKRTYALHIDIADQPGMIAEVALILANRRISIRNIGITHNREFQEGVLRVELQNEKEEHSARMLLISKGYTVH